MTDSVADRPAVTVDDDFEDEFPDARRAATLCAASVMRTANRLLSEIDRRRRTVADLSASASQILAIVEGARVSRSRRMSSRIGFLSRAVP